MLEFDEITANGVTIPVKGTLEMKPAAQGFYGPILGRWHGAEADGVLRITQRAQRGQRSRRSKRGQRSSEKPWSRR